MGYNLDNCGTTLTLLPVLESSRVQKISGSIGLPYLDFFLTENLGISGSCHEPEQLLGHTSPENTLCGQ